MKINRLKIVLANGYNVKVDPSAGNTDPSIKVFFIPTDDLTILLFFLDFHLYYGKLSIIKVKAIECRIEKHSWTSKFYSILLQWIVYLLVPKMLHSNLPIMLHSYGSSPILMHLSSL